MTPPATTPHRASGGVSLLATVAGADVVWLATRDNVHGWMVWPGLLAAVGSHLLLVARERRRPTLTLAQIRVAIGVVLVAAVLLPAAGSHDVYAYAFLGRMVTWHRANPYLVAPTRFATDPLLGSVAHAWWRGRTVYGPVFTLLSAVGAVGFGSSPLLARLFFQAVDAAALVAVLHLLARRKAGHDVLLFLGLGPAIVATVNGGHNDLLAGLLLLVGVLLLGDQRAVAAGAALAAAVLVKLLVLPGVVCVLVVLVAQRRSRDARRVAAVVVGASALAYLAVGGLAALAPLRTTDRVTSRFSVWRGIEAVDAVVRAPLSSVGIQHLAALVGLLVGGVFVAGLRRRTPTAAAAAGGVLALLLVAQYVLPWYSALALPVAAVLAPRWRSLVYAQATLALLVYVTAPGRAMGPVPGLHLVMGVAPVVEIALVVALLARCWADQARPDGGGEAEVPEPPPDGDRRHVHPVRGAGIGEIGSGPVGPLVT